MEAAIRQDRREEAVKSRSDWYGGREVMMISRFWRRHTADKPALALPQEGANHSIALRLPTRQSLLPLTDTLFSSQGRRAGQE